LRKEPPRVRSILPIFLAVGCGVVGGAVVALSGRSLLLGSAPPVFSPVAQPSPDPYWRPRGPRRYFNTFENDIEAYLRERAFRLKDLKHLIWRVMAGEGAGVFDPEDAIRHPRLSDSAPFLQMLREYLADSGSSFVLPETRYFRSAEESRVIRIGSIYYICWNAFDRERAPSFLVDYVDYLAEIENDMDPVEFARITTEPDLKWPMQFLAENELAPVKAKGAQDTDASASAIADSDTNQDAGKDGAPGHRPRAIFRLQPPAPTSSTPR